MDNQAYPKTHLDHEPEPMRVLATRYPEGTELRAVCPDCLKHGNMVIEKTYCYWCLVLYGRWVRVAWGRASLG